ncbi:MAG: hypothetical protein HY758_06710, partial [Nitrospirae bacterium]|nr:hypothetical protein [Nitrospirota bacterium]
QEGDDKRLNTIFRMLDILASPSAYVLPSRVADNLSGSLDFIAGNVDVFITRVQYNDRIDSLIIPEEMRAEINSAISSGLPLEYLKGLERLKQGSLLTKDETGKLGDEYVIPAWLENDIFGKETDRYVEAIKLFRQMKEDGLFIKKSDFLDYLRKYFQYIAYIIDTKGVVQRIQKGETLEQRWIRLLKSDIGRADYIKLAGYIKNNVMLSLIAYVEDITNSMSAQADAADPVKEIINYLNVLKSGQVKWDDADKQIVNELHSFIFRKKTSFMQYIDKISEGIAGKHIRKALKVVFGINADERTRQTEAALAGILCGTLTGFMAWIIIADIEAEASFYGPVILGLMTGLIRKSIPVALVCAVTGFAGAFFLDLEAALEIVFSFAIAILGFAKTGALIGKRFNKFSFYDDLLKKYNDRMNNVANSALQ